MVAAGIAALEEALSWRVEVPAGGGVPAVRLEAPEIREIGPVARRFSREVAEFVKVQAEYAAIDRPTAAQRAEFEQEHAGRFADALVEASIGALRACVRDPADPDARLSEPAARALQAAQDALPTERSAWRQALKLCRIIDLDEYDRAIEEAAKKGKRRGSGEAAAPVVDFPPSTN